MSRPKKKARTEQAFVEDGTHWYAVSADAPIGVVVNQLMVLRDILLLGTPGSDARELAEQLETLVEEHRDALDAWEREMEEEKVS